MAKQKNEFMAIRGVPKDLRQQFRIACMKADMTSRDAIINLMKVFIKKVEGEK